MPGDPSIGGFVRVTSGVRCSRKALLGALVAFAALFFGLQATAQAAHYSISLTFEFRNNFPAQTHVKVVRRDSVCVAIHPSDPKEVGNQPRINLGTADVDTGGDCFWSASEAYLKLENARTDAVLAYLNVVQSGPRLFSVACKAGADAQPKVARCSGGNDPLGPRWYWTIVH
jgi:hypothetical protein